MSANFDPTMYRDELQVAKHAASQAFHEAMQPPEAPRAFIQSCWAELVRRNQLPTNSPATQRDAAREALDVMKAISQLAPQHYRALTPENYRTPAGVHDLDGSGAAAAFAAAVASSSVLAKFQGERDAKASQERAEIEANRQSAEAQRLRDLPRDSLAMWRARGLVFGLTDNDQVTVLPRSHGLTPSEIDLIRERLPDFVELVRSELDAVAPVVIA